MTDRSSCGWCRDPYCTGDHSGDKAAERGIWPTETPDRKLAAVTECLQEFPLEERVPGFGGNGLSAWDKAELLALLDDEECE